MITTFLINVYELISGFAVIILPLCFLFGYDVRKKKIPFISVFTGLVVIDIVFGILLNNADDFSFITETITMISSTVLPYFIIKPKKKLTFALFGLTMTALIDYLEFSIALALGEIPIIYEQIIYCVLNTLIIAAVLMVYRFGSVKAPEDFLEKISPVVYLVIFFAYFSTYYDVMISKDSTYYVQASSALKLLSAFLIVAAIVYMVYRYTALSMKQKEAEIQHSLEVNYYEDMMRRNRDIRTFRHDYKNNLFSLNTLIKSQRYDEADRFIENLSDDLELTRNRFNSGNYLVDAILSDKAQKCENDGIEIEFDGRACDKEIDNNTICTIFSNAVDNAVRACAEIAPCKIKISSELKSNGITIRFRNPVKEKVIIKNNSVKTTKSDKLNHGLGLSNIKKAAQKYNGYAEVKCDDTEFTLEIGLIFNVKFD